MVNTLFIYSQQCLKKLSFQYLFFFIFGSILNYFRALTMRDKTSSTKHFAWFLRGVTVLPLTLNYHSAAYFALKRVVVLIQTFLCGWSPDNVVGQCCSFTHAVSNVKYRTIFLNMRVGCHSINVDIVAHINLHRN